MQINDLQLKLEVLQKTLEKKRQNTKFGESSNLLNSTITSSSSSSQLNNSAQIISPSTTTTTTPTLLKQTSEQPSSNSNISNSLDILALNDTDNNNSKQADSINARNTVSLDENTTQSNTATVSDCSSSPTLSSTSSTSSSSSSSPQQQQQQQQQLNQQQQLPESTRALNDLPNIINTPKSIKIHKISSSSNDENINNDAKSESTN